MTPADSAQVQVSVTANAGTTPQLAVTLSTEQNPPQNSGLTFFPPQGFLTTSNPVSFTVEAEVSAQPIQNYPIVVTATDQSNNSSVALVPLTVSVPFSASTTPTRSNFARTDQGPTGVVYDQLRKLLFVSVEILNQVQVFSSVDGHRVTTIPVMYPAGIDESSDGSSVYVVSPFSSLITTIDPASFQVVNQASIPQNQAGFQVATLSNGDVLILTATDTTAPGTVYLWNPAAKTIISFGQSAGSMVRSADHSKVLLIGTSFSGGTAVLYDVTSNSFATSSDSIGGANMAISPDGSQIVQAGYSNSSTVFYDQNFNPLGSISLDFQPLYGTIYSLDGNQAYVFGDDFMGAGNVVAAIDTHTFQLVGIVPSFAFGIGLPFSGQWLTPFAIDETRMLFGGVSRGMGYLDLSSPGTINLPASRIDLVQPTLLSLGEPTQLQMSGAYLSPSLSYHVYFGAPPASPSAQTGTNISIQNANTLSVTAPAGIAAGPANVTFVRSDGLFQVLPDWVSYGPTILMVDANAGSPAGGDAIEVIGYGFDGGNVQVSIGGQPATVTQVNGPTSTAQFATERILLTTPPGNPGYADVVVTTASGSTTATRGFEYLTSAKIYPITGALDDIVYDQIRKRLYLSNQDHNRVEVFDLTSDSYVSPVAVGNQPTSLALTPDGALLAVLNSADMTVSVITLSNMQVTATYSAVNSNDAGNVPVALSPVEPHRMLVDLVCTGCLDAGVIHLLDLGTGSLSCSGVAGCSGGNIVFGSGVDAMASTPDGSKVFLADYYGGLGLLNLTANQLTTANLFSAQDAAADADGNIFAAQFGILNAALSQTSIMAYEPYADSGTQSFHNVPGEKLSPSGSLLFQPQDSGVDIFDVHTGRIVLHADMPEGIPFDSGAMALDETSSKMFLISNSGITVAQLFELPLSLASITPATGPAGTQVKLRGSGFVTGSAVIFGTSQVPATYVDQNTLTAVVPALSTTGPVRVTVTNPDGRTYSYDALFSAQ
ncbi:MAG TPA: IPT/TIG domain-containing protein [Candidatus Binatia bacterium]|nr:IPT/TIG domain-containing protein [Candidatus Binatia bacterium]